jgi:hypothetical protein
MQAAQGSTALATKAKRPVTVERILQKVKQAERNDMLRGERATRATGFTLLKMISKPIARLVDLRKIGPEELQAADDITTAFMAMAGALLIRPMEMERTDRAYQHTEPVRVADAQRRYRNWADHWSMLAKRGDKTLEIVIAAVIDERAFHVIDTDLNLSHGKAQKALIRGLRDYAARVTDGHGKPIWVDYRTAAQWRLEAGMSFKTQHPIITLAAAAARILRRET